MNLTGSGMVMELRDLQPVKASLPIDVTEFPMVTEVSDLHLWNRPSAREVTASGM